MKKCICLSAFQLCIEVDPVQQYMIFHSVGILLPTRSFESCFGCDTSEKNYSKFKKKDKVLLVFCLYSISCCGKHNRASHIRGTGAIDNFVAKGKDD